jgi:hypothetical protein
VEEWKRGKWKSGGLGECWISWIQWERGGVEVRDSERVAEWCGTVGKWKSGRVAERESVIVERGKV